MKVMKILFFIVLNKNFIIPIYYDFDFEKAILDGSRLQKKGPNQNGS